MTKKRHKILNDAISVDDLLYRKYQLMRERFEKDVARWNREKQVVQVLQEVGDQVHSLQIIKEYKTADGIVVTVSI